MTQTNNSAGQPIHLAPFIKPMVIGGTIALFLISLFLFSDPDPDPAWPRFWIVKPLVLTSLAGAFGGAFYHLLQGMRSQGGWIMVVGYVLGILGYAVVLWLGCVLGLSNTYWD